MQRDYSVDRGHADLFPAQPQNERSHAPQKSQSAESLANSPDPADADHKIEGALGEMNKVTEVVHHLNAEEMKFLARMREMRRQRPAPVQPGFSIGEKIADSVAATMGSWNFILIQSALLLVWIVLNVTAYFRHWDPYPFILLNLALSFQAAYAAPFIMMSQNRQATIDRSAAETDYSINAKAELEIELLHQKLDLLRETEVSELIQVIRRLEARLPPSG